MEGIEKEWGTTRKVGGELGGEQRAVDELRIMRSRGNIYFV
jgi:hypothetical protein